MPEPTSPIDVTDSEIKDLLAGSKLPVVLEFWSPTCSYCRKMVKVLDALASEYAGRLLVARMNVLENSSPYDFGVTGIPVFFLIEGGRITGKALGPMPKGRLKKELGIA